MPRTKQSARKSVPSVRLFGDAYTSWLDMFARQTIAHDRLTCVTDLARNLPLEAISDTRRALVYKHLAPNGAVTTTVVDVDEPTPTHRLFFANAAHANPMFGALGKQAFVDTPAQFRNNLNDFYFGSDADAVWREWNVEPFRSRVIIAGDAVAICSLANAECVANVHRTPGLPYLPVEAIGGRRSGVTFYVIKGVDDPEASALIAREWCIRLAKVLHEGNGNIPVAALWKTNRSFTIVRVGAPNIEVLLKPRSDLSFVTQLDVAPCQFVYNNDSGCVFATWNAVDAICSRSFVAEEEMDTSRVLFWVGHGLAVWVNTQNVELMHLMAQSERASCLGLGDGPQVFGVLNVKRVTDPDVHEWVMAASCAGKGASTGIGGEETHAERTSPQAPPPPSFDIFESSTACKYVHPFCANVYLRPLHAKMQTGIDVGYLAYATAAGRFGALRVERPPAGTGAIVGVILDMFNNPRVPSAETICTAMAVDGRARAALSSSAAESARLHGAELPSADAWKAACDSATGSTA